MNSNKSKLKLISKRNYNEIDNINDEKLRKKIDCISEIAAMQAAIKMHNDHKNNAFRHHTPPYYIKDIRVYFHMVILTLLFLMYIIRMF